MWTHREGKCASEMAKEGCARTGGGNSKGVCERGSVGVRLRESVAVDVCARVSVRERERERKRE